MRACMRSFVSFSGARNAAAATTNSARIINISNLYFMPAPFVSEIKYMHIDYFGIEYIAIQIFKYEYCHFFPGKKRIIIE